MPDQVTNAVRESQKLPSPRFRLPGRRLAWKGEVSRPTGYEKVHTLEDVFTLVPLYFVFAQKDYTSLCCTSKCMQQALQFVPQGLVLERDGYIDLERDGVISCTVPAGARVDSIKLQILWSATYLEIPAGIGFADMLKTGRAKYVPTRLPAMPHLRFLDFESAYIPATSKKVHYVPIPALELSSISRSLLELRIKAINDESKICFSPIQNFDSMFPSLVSLKLCDVTFSYRKLVCPPTLTLLDLQGVHELYEIEFASAAIDDLCYYWVKHLKLESFPATVAKLAIFAQPEISAEIPSSVRELEMEAHQFLTTNVPLALEYLAIHRSEDYPLNYTEDFDYRLGQKFLANSHFGLVTTSHFTNLKKLELYEVPFRQFVVPDGVQSLKWRPRNRATNHDITVNRITLPRSIRKLYVYSSFEYHQKNFVLPPYAELICILTMHNVSRLIIPPTCRTLVLYGFDNLQYLVFDGCKPTCIYLARMPKLKSIRSINHAVVPDISIPIRESFQYGNDKYEDFYGTFKPCDKFIDWY